VRVEAAGKEAVVKKVSREEAAAEEEEEEGGRGRGLVRLRWAVFAIHHEAVRG